MKETYHIYKSNCFQSSRVMLQASWDSRPVFMHPCSKNSSKSSQETGIEELNYSLKSIYKLAVADKSDIIAVFHGQSSLPYLIFFNVITKLIGKKNITMVYDMHDLHEYYDAPGLWYWFRYRVVRYSIIGLLEYQCVKIRPLKIMTISNGVAELVREKYKIHRPKVVMSIPKPNIPTKSGVLTNSSNKKTSLIYFGNIGRAPLALLEKISSEKLRIDLFGRDITESALRAKGCMINDEFVRICGAYSPQDLLFLQNYSISVLYQPEATYQNFKYSLPNKLFQSLGYGLSMMVSENFIEMRELFSDIPGAIGVISTEEKLERQIDNLLSMRGKDYANRIIEKLIKLHYSAETTYKQTLYSEMQKQENARN